MVDTLKPVAVAQLTTSTTTLYTVPVSTKAVVAMIHIVNVTANAATIRMHVVPNAGSASASNAILYDFSIPANDFIDFGKGLMLDAQNFVQGQASANSALNVKIDVIESA